MRTSKTIAALAVALSLATVARATSITWSDPAVILGDESNVSLQGTQIDGIQGYTGSGAELTLQNGAVFHQTTLTGDSTEDALGDIVITSSQHYNVPSGGGIGSDPAYTYLLSHTVRGPGVGGTITFNNLLAGHQYQVEVWCYYSGVATKGLNLAGSTPVGMSGWVTASGSGSLVIGTFTAGGSSFVEDFSYAHYPGASNDLNGNVPDYTDYAINGIQLRDLTPPVPEPSTLLLFGVGGALLWRRRRNR